MTVRLLALDDDEDILQSIRLLLAGENLEIRTESDPARLSITLSAFSPEIVLLDLNYQRGANSGEEGIRLVSMIKDHNPDIVVVVMTAYADVSVAVTAVKSGAFDFVIKPWENDKLLATLNAAEQLVESRTDLKKTRAQNELLRSALQPAPIISQSEGMQSLLQIADKVAPTDANVLLLGENGTGKQLVARYLHDRSTRSSEPFVHVDLGAIPETLFESELFGHKKGAFTGATEDRPGRFIAASGGSLFLDEIGNLPMHLQAKLLVALEQRQVVPVGTEEPVPFDVRLICATNLAKDSLLNPESFRSDLLYRINTVEMLLPSLKDRPEDIPLLLNHYLAIYSKRYHKPAKKLSEHCLETLCRYPWPGNVRALQHAVERAVIMSEHEVIEVKDFPIEDSVVIEAQEPGARNLNLEDLEREAISEALIKTTGNVSKAAKLLGLTRAALYRRMEKYDL